jgi:2-dehydro-3-deoxyphosphogluconate aldolase/(4S)-4-hydroxy-2-oxoglutarate aldolase
MSHLTQSVVDDSVFQTSMGGAMSREDVRLRVEEVGVVPAVGVESAEDAYFVAEALAQAGVPILEIAMNVPGAAHVLSQVVRRAPKMILGGGSVTDVVTAQRCLDAGARFLTSDGLVLPVVDFAVKRGVAVFPGAFTPTEIIAARSAGADLVKVVPCDAAGGHSYIRSLKAAMPDARLIAAGGVTQQTALQIIAAGATALGVGRDLVPVEAIRLRQSARIQELARRFVNFVDNGRIQAVGQSYSFA